MKTCGIELPLKKSDMKFKTNINCGGCIAAVQPYLDEVEGIDTWEVDTQSPKKYLTVEGNVSPEAIQKAVKAAGYEIEPVKSNIFKRIFS